MPSLYAQADILLISLKDKNIFSLTIPVKLQPYMASGKPIAGMLNGVGAELISKANCGFTCAAGDYVSLSGFVIKAHKMNQETLYELGQNGKNYHDKTFQKEVIINNLTSIIDA
jgi:glycosyltransferase involved in cell wall biosynthesis